jgi:hypothetical protein
VYNSKSDFTGMFGYSWGTEYETKLKLDPDGSVIISEFGGEALYGKDRLQINPIHDKFIFA